MEIWQLKTFKVIAETLNFTKASEKLNLTQSAVSHQIKALESELGEPLFIRTKKGVILTNAGKIMLESANRILAEADELRDKIQGISKIVSGRVRVAAATQALVYFFAPIFKGFMKTHENIELVFRTTVSTEQTVEDILNGVADVGFASLPIYSPNLQVVELFDDELFLVVGKKHHLAEKREVTFEELNAEKWILFERGASIRRTTDNFFKDLGIVPEMSLESNDAYFIKMLIENGLGVSLLPLWAVRDEVNHEKLAIVKIANREIKRSVAMVSLKGFKPAQVRAFTKYVLERKEKLQSWAIAKK
ncbi:MAG: LysR family transcriptional regulator [Pyrinomonadaceae bacterium]|jgi:DNA-binding transcriptional LysR family regulator|nr:LysR family transcriptional regulator [Pyrinomonadaceae bacterium]